MDRQYSKIADLHSSQRTERVQRSNGQARSTFSSSSSRSKTTEQQGGGIDVDSFAIRQCEEFRQQLSERMVQAEHASKALLEAKQNIHVEAMLAQAKAESEAWKHDKSKLAAVKAAQHLSPLGVRAIIAERDELRYQLRKAASELTKVFCFDS